MGQRLELRTEQKLVMTPMLQHALKVLQLPALELTNLVREEMSENPMLEELEEEELAERGPATELETVRTESNEHTQEVLVNEDGIGPLGFDKEEWDRYFNDEDYEIPKYEREIPAEFLEPQIPKQPTLQEHLLWQLRLVSADEEEYRIGELIIGNLEENGFLTYPLEEIAREAGTDPERVADVLETIQGLEPLGVAARSVQESLLIQLRNLPERNTLAELLVEKHFDAVERNQLDSIARLEKVNRALVNEAVQLIAGLDPYPGRHEFTGPVEYVIPDVVVEKHSDQYLIRINEETVPELKISKTYRQLMKRGANIPPETRKFLDDKLQRAVWLIRSLEQRRKTLYRVMETILEVQMDFFEKGIEHLKPLTLREIASRLSLHESTISRVTSKKYAQTPRGLFELKYFFSSQIQTADGIGISSTSVKAAVQELIAQEDTRHPLSDERLARLLAEKGFRIARRTVTKYREELRLFPANRRKRVESARSPQE